MASPVPYSKPKRRIVNRKSIVFRTRKGSFVYAPARGRLHKAKNGVIITTKDGAQHRLSGVAAGKVGQVEGGERIGRAYGRKVIYRKFIHKKQVDALPVVRRKDNQRPKEWLPVAQKNYARGEAGQMGPGDERVAVWHTSESGNDKNAIHGVANWVRQTQIEYNILWNPYTGQFVQLFPANVGGRALMNAPRMATNRHGKIRIQICVIGRAANAPLAKSPMKGRRELMEWLDSWGIPRRFTCNTSNPKRSYSDWTKSGHTTHSAAPGNDHTDPGRIDKGKLFAP